MAFVFSAFLGGAAKGALDIIEQEEKDARTNAAIKAKTLYENYQQNRKDTVKLRQELVENVSKLNDAIPADAFESPQARETALYELATKPGAMKKLNQIIDDRTFDPKSIAWKDLIKLQGDPSDETALARVMKATTLPTTLPEAMPTTTPLKAATADKAIKAGQKTKGGGLFAGFGQAEEERAFKEAAVSVGLTPEALRAGAAYTRQPIESKAQIDYSVFTPPEDYNKKVDNAKVELNAALQSGDKTRIDKAVADAARHAAVQAAFVPASKETEKDVEKKIIDDIVKARGEGNVKEVARLTTELRLRQNLSKLPEPEKKEQLSPANMIAIAKGAVNGTVSAMMPAGSLTVNQNGDLVPTKLSEDAVHKEAVYRGRLVAINMFAPKGVAADPAAAGALASIGISVDPVTKKVIMPTEPASSTTPTPTAPAPTATPTKAASSLAPAQKTVTRAQVEAVARSKGITYDVAKKQAESEGFTIK